MVNEPRPSDLGAGLRGLALEQAAAIIGFTPRDFLKWVRLHLLPAADSNTGGWTKESLDRALNMLACNGWPAHHKLPDIQRQPRKNTLDIKKYHHYRRGVRGRLKGEPGSGVYMASLIAKNRELAREQTATQQPDDRPERPLPIASASSEQQQTLPISSDAILHMGGLVPSDHDLPLYPTEHQIACAVLGTERADQWPALAAHLAKQGLPPIDPMANARFWPAVRAYFEARHGLAPRFAFDQRTSLIPARTKGSFHSLRPTEPVYAPNAPGPSMYLRADELAERWRHVLTTETLKNHRSKKVGVPFVTIGRKPLYRLSDVEEFEKQQLNPKYRS